MRIIDIEVTRHRTNIQPVFRSSWDPRPLETFKTTMVRVTLEDGTQGFGSGDHMIGFESYKDLFIGTDAFDFERHNKLLDGISLFYARPWPLDLALWDLKGKVENKPVYQLLGGSSGKIPLYASTGVVRPPMEMANQACVLRDMGFKAIKFRIARRPVDDDIAALCAVRAAVGDEIEIMVDANQAWRMPWDLSPIWTAEHAESVIEKMIDLDIYWVEEPLHRGDFEGLRQLRSIENGPRIASGEMNTEYHELRHLMKSGCVDVLQTDCVYFGGITGLSKIAHEAVEHCVTFSPHTWGNGIGFLANAHLAAGTVPPPYLEYAIDPPEWTIEERDFMLMNLVQHDGNGYIELGDRPGLGFEINEEILAQTRVE